MSKQYFNAYDRITGLAVTTPKGRLSRFLEGSKRYKEIIKTHDVKPIVKSSKQSYNIYIRNTDEPLTTLNGRLNRVIEGSRRFNELKQKYDLRPISAPVKFYLLDGPNGYPIMTKNKQGYVSILSNDKDFDKVKNKVRADQLTYQVFNKIMNITNNRITNEDIEREKADEAIKDKDNKPIDRLIINNIKSISDKITYPVNVRMKEIFTVMGRETAIDLERDYLIVGTKENILNEARASAEKSKLEGRPTIFNHREKLQKAVLPGESFLDYSQRMWQIEHLKNNLTDEENVKKLNLIRYGTNDKAEIEKIKKGIDDEFKSILGDGMVKKEIVDILSKNKKEPENMHEKINNETAVIQARAMVFTAKNFEELVVSVDEIVKKAAEQYQARDYIFLFENNKKAKPMEFSFLAKSKTENCVVKAARLVKGNKVAANIYDDLPQLAKDTAQALGIRVEDLANYHNTLKLSRFIEVDHTIIKKIARSGQFLFTFYSPLGLLLSSPWKTIGGPNYKKINLVVKNNHCELLNKQEYTKVCILADKWTQVLDKYGYVVDNKIPLTAQEFLDDKGNLTHYIDYETKDDGSLKDIVLHKYVDPSRIDLPCIKKHYENGVFDQLKLAFIITEQQLFSYCARKHFKLSYTAANLKDIVKKSIVFITNGFTGEVKLGMNWETDKNRCYMSYRTNSYYKGFPKSTLYEMAYCEDKKDHIAFVIPKKIDISKSLYAEAISFILRRNSLECLTYVLYLWLINNGCEIEIEYCLYTGGFQDIDLLEFYRSHNFGDMCHEKFRTNKFIGELITGGLEENNIKRFHNMNNETMKQIVYEASENELPYTVDSYVQPNGRDRVIKYVDSNDIRYKYGDVGFLDDSGKIRIISDEENFDEFVDLPRWQGCVCDENGIMKAHVSKDYDVKKDTTHYVTVDVKKKIPSKDGIFHTYSWFLTYACITMLELWKKCINDSVKVLAFNVDSLITDKKIVGIPINYEIDGWKQKECEMIKKKYLLATPMENLVLEFNNVMTDPKPFVESDRLLIHGPAGISKSHNLYSQKMSDTVMTAPTKVLRDSIRKNANGNLDCMTIQKLFGLNMSDRVWSIYLHNNKDKLKKYKWVIVDEFTQLTQAQIKTILRRCGNCVLILLGDFAQITCDIEDKAVTQEFFKKKGFTFRWMGRKRGAYARHSYEYGRQLDSLRHDKFETLDDIGYNVITSADELEEKIKGNPNSCVVAYTHDKNLIYNNIYRKHSNRILCVDKKNNSFIVDVNDPHIWWDRRNMKEKAPKNKVEPRFSRTIYSLQGSQSSELTYFIDIKDLKTVKGAVYTALTRAVNKEQIYLLKFDEEATRVLKEKWTPTRRTLRN